MSFFRKECSLCGGRLENNICVECGLDNSKSDDNYVLAGKTHRDPNALTHVHEEHDPLAGKMVTKEWLKKAKEQQKTKNVVSTKNIHKSNAASQNKKKKSKAGVVLAMIVLLANVVPAFMGLVGELLYSSYVSVPEMGVEEVIPYEDPYAYVTYELPTDGMIYEVDLTAGVYKGGVHIPEGRYDVIFIPEEGTDDSYADLRMSDMENGIYQSFYFGDSEMLYNIGDFRIYAGGIMEIEGRGTLHFYSTTAQPQDMYFQDNPNTQNYYVSDAFEVGTDIVPGVYDVICESGSGIFDYEIEHIDGYMMYCGKLIGDQASGFAGTLKNVVLPAGTMVYIDGMEVQLVPSEKIESEEYLTFYNNY